MAITLAKAKLLTQDKLYNKVIDELRMDKLLDLMIFDNSATINGGGTLVYSYNKITTHATAGFRAINTDYTADEATTDIKSVELKVLGGKYGIDRVIHKYVKGVAYANQEAFQMEEKIKAVKRAFSQSFIKGDASKDSKTFDGLDKLISSNMVFGGSGAIDLSSSAKITSNYTDLTDALRDAAAKFDGTPTAYFCSPEGYAVIQKIADRATGFTVTKDTFGKEAFYFNGILFVPLGDVTGSANEVIGTSDAGETAFYPVRIGLDAVHGISPVGEDAGISAYPIDASSSDAVREGAVEMVTAIAVKNDRTAAKVLVKISA
jgi:hypothetical protein